MKLLTKGKYTAFKASDFSEIAAAQALRAECFGMAQPFDVDGYDDRSTHIIIKETDVGTIVCCFRVLILKPADLAQSYAAEFYDLSALYQYDGLMMELGRFCVHPDWSDPDILRLAWAVLTDIVDAQGVDLLFGCSSFEGIEQTLYLDAFAILKSRHLAPEPWQPKVRAPDVFCFADEVSGDADAKQGMAHMPPLLRTYLMMGGWVSDHAVIDHQLNTMHVFTGLEINAIPENRKRLLRALV